MDKKTIWFDVDDVLVETSFRTEASLRALTGREIPWETWPHHHFLDLYGLGEAGRASMVERWVDDQVLEKATLRDGVGEAMRELAEDGFELRLITARGWHPRGAQITWEMAEEHRLPVSGVSLTLFEDDKSEALASWGARVDAFVDDTTRHVRGCLDKGWAAWVMTQPWNQGHELPRRAANMHDFAQAARAQLLAPKRRLG